MALEWFGSYLKDRSLRVKCKTISTGTETKSDLYPIKYGMPQGSCLRSLIFLIFVNDLHLHLELLRCIQFTDNTTLLVSHSNLRYLHFCVQTDLNNIQDWFTANKLTLNVDKTVMMIFGRNCTSMELNISLNGVLIPQVYSTKFLGIWLDDKLQHSHTHITVLKSRLQSRQGLLRGSKHFLSTHCMRILYFARLQSILTYGIVA